MKKLKPRRRRLKSEVYSNHRKRMYSVPKEMKEFWGAEFMTPKGILTLESAIDRIGIYVKANHLLSEDGQTFKIDDTLRMVFQTEQQRADYNHVRKFLNPYSVMAS